VGFNILRGWRVDVHPLRDLGQRQMLAFRHGLETRHELQNRRETLLIDGAPRPLADRAFRVLTTNRFLFGPLLGGALWLDRWFHRFTLSVRECAIRVADVPILCAKSAVAKR
jgi:hypothetical protein